MDENPELIVPRAQLEAELEDRINRGGDIEQRQIASPEDLELVRNEYKTWNEYNRTLLRRSFSTERVLVFDYDKAAPRIHQWDVPFESKVRSVRSQVQGRIRELASIKDQLPNGLSTM
jgi:hypothetical protein